MTTRKSTRAAKTPARAGKAQSAASPRKTGSSTKSAPAKRKAAAKPQRGAPKKAAKADADVWTLRLYITGRGERSERALRNLRSLCEANMKEGTYKIEVIDLLKNPALAKTDQILAIPTLVRKLPEPMKRIIGDLSDADRAILTLDLPKQQ